jgi:hypothetical protein
MRFTGMLVSLAVSPLAFVNAADAGDMKWRASRVLVGADANSGPDERTCGPQMVRRFNVEIKGNVVRRRASSGAPIDLKLLDPLNPDGSGKVRALNSKNREVILTVDAGDGPRTIRYTAPYSVCTWAWVPV